MVSSRKRLRGGNEEGASAGLLQRHRQLELQRVEQRFEAAMEIAIEGATRGWPMPEQDPVRSSGYPSPRAARATTLLLTSSMSEMAWIV